MRDSGRKTRVSPPLMFAFRDAHRARDARKVIDARDKSGERVVAARKSLRASITEPQLRAELTRDLEALMNTTNLASAQDLSGHAMVQASIVNFGLPDITRITIDENRVETIVEGIETAILTFEPRMVRRSLSVSRDRNLDAATLSLRFNVSGEMESDPVSLPVEFVADLEVASGKLALTRK